MAGNPPSLWRRVTDLGPRADKLRAALPAHLELPADAYTTHEIVRRDGEGLTSIDHWQIARRLAQISPTIPVGVINAEQAEFLRQTGRTGECETCAFLRHRHRTESAELSVYELGKPAAGVIRLRPDGTIPAVTRPRTGDVKAPWRVSLEASQAAQRLADRWGCSQSQAVSRALVERLVREQEGEAKLENAVLDRVLENRQAPQK